MNRNLILALGATLVLAGCATGGAGERRPAGMHAMPAGPTGMAMHQGMGPMAGMMGAMRTMDADGDGAVTRSEYLRAHEAMFEAMPKDPQGRIAMGSMAMCPMMGAPMGGMR